MRCGAKFVVVTGGVLSGLGKGLFISSLGRLLKSRGYKIIPIKIDPYVNVDAGTMNPIEHGEVFVLDDGSEVDMDLGNYERFLDLNLTTESNITTGKIYRKVIEKERKGDYLGKTVQLIPHVTGELKEWYRKLAEKTGADIVLIEIGGTVGDIENQIFLESVRELSMEEDVFFIHCTLVPVLKVVGEQKTKPTQQSVRMLREMGIFPNMIYCRSEKPLLERTKEKISRFCGVPQEYVISGYDVKHIYEIPLVLEEQNVAKNVLKELGLKERSKDMEDWKKFVENLKNPKKKVKIAITGKYTYLHDSYVSILEALEHAGGNLSCNVELKWIETTDIENGKLSVEDALKDVDGILVPGGFGSRGAEGKIECIRYARENNIPFLGLCYGLQLAVVEYARNVCGLKDADSTEINPDTPHPVIDILPEQKKINEKGATMRLGAQPAILKDRTLVRKLYGKEKIVERHRHRYEVNPKYIEILERNGLVFSGVSPNRKLMEFLEIPKHRFFVATQAHPEFTSRPLRPNPMFLGFVKACMS
ncbi:MAG: CTP synthase (glutamine hydrolyzing) [Candidatus Aenigmarchaeota archaeon]|nr:CTP synthase (glutamine hydrolyzing) [Candidatus Aenigmarchaeota archaeon]